MSRCQGCDRALLVSMLAQACELETLSDCLIIGMPELRRWGMHLVGVDMDGGPAVQFSTYDLGSEGVGP